MERNRRYWLIGWLIGGTTCFGLIALGLVLWLQFVQRVEPCSLCIWQRLADVLMLLLLGLGALWKPLRFGLWVLAACAALGGAVLALQQWQLATSVSGQGVCSAVQLLPSSHWGGHSFADHLSAAFAGQGSCALAGQQTLAGWPLTHWSLLFFLGAALAIMVALLLSWQLRRSS
ncbi:MAG: disulfide bond formation protein B [Acidithiobacillus sp.]|nr:disulfide bond formation protein B [Acidithiobacillus sp.]